MYDKFHQLTLYVLMANQESSRAVGRLLNVSGSMRNTLKTRGSDDRAINHFHAVLSAALNIARKEQQVDYRSKTFVGVFGLDHYEAYVGYIA
jgi:hypothetical protein